MVSHSCWCTDQSSSLYQMHNHASQTFCQTFMLMHWCTTFGFLFTATRYWTFCRTPWCTFRRTSWKASLALLFDVLHRMKCDSPSRCTSLVLSAPRYPSPQFTLGGCPIESILSNSLDPLLRILVCLQFLAKSRSSILALSCWPAAVYLSLLTSCSRDSFFLFTAASSSSILICF